MTMATKKRKRKPDFFSKKLTPTQKKQMKKMVKSGKLTKTEIIDKIKRHKLRFDIDYEKGVYDITPREADIFDDSIDDILTIIKKLKK